MAFNVGALANAATSAKAISSLILVKPQNQGIKAQNQAEKGAVSKVIDFITDQPPAFFFDYEGENAMVLQSDITDHFVEDNTVLNDQIALKPEKYTVTGFIGELNDITPRIFEPAKFIVEKLQVVSAYKPGLSRSATIGYNRAVSLYSTARSFGNSAVSSWNSLRGTSQNKQQKAYFQFYGYWRNRTLFTVQTPWAIYKDMAIESLRVTQPEDTDKTSDFEITFKKIRFAQTSISSATFQSGRALNQAADMSKNGTTNPVEAVPFQQAFSASYGGAL